MFKTRVTEMLGIQYPIICGPYGNIPQVELAAAVSNCGGLGIIASAHYKTPEDLRKAVRQIKKLTNKPFGVNISLFPSVMPLPNAGYVDVIVEEGVKVAESSGVRDPGEFVARLRQGKVTIIHKAATVRHCLKGQEAGADILTIVGMENGGATGMDDVSTLVLVPILADVAKVPIMAGGGFADARGLVAALALGAEGIVMGTRFMATKECVIHPKYKEWLLRATERDTVQIMRSIQNTHRVLKSKAADEILAMEAKGASLQELLPHIGGEVIKKVALEGDFEAGHAMAGEVVGLIHDIPSVKELMDRMINDSKTIMQRLQKMGVGK